MEFPSPKSLRMPAQAQTVLDWQESIHKDCGWQNLEKIHAAWFAQKIPYCFFPLAHKNCQYSQKPQKDEHQSQRSKSLPKVGRDLCEQIRSKVTKSLFGR